MDNPKGEKLCNCGPETFLHGKSSTDTKKMLLQEVTALQDESGAWYVIPKELHSDFRDTLDKALDQNNDEDVRAYYEGKFLNEFSQYRTGGDLNNVQLYAEVKPA